MAQLLTALLGAHCLQILHRPEGMRPGDLKKQKLTFDGYHMTVSGISVYSNISCRTTSRRCVHSVSGQCAEAGAALVVVTCQASISALAWVLPERCVWMLQA